MKRWRSIWQSPWPGLIVVIGAAALLRYPLLDTLPPGLNFDEGGEGIAALDVSQGIYRLWWPIGGGKEPLMAYLVQPLFWLLGPTRLALRLYTATLGVLAAAGTYWLAWELFSAPSRERRTPDSARFSLLAASGPLLPLLAGLGLATAFWHVAYSRIAFRALAMPAVEALALAWLWRAVRSSEASDREPATAYRHFAGAGFFVGLGAYTYLAGRFVPLGILLFLLAEAVLAWRARQRPSLINHWRGWLLAGSVAGLVFAPLAFFFITHPGTFAERASSVSVFNPAWNQGDLWGTLLRTTLITLGTWVGLTGDPNPLGNLPGRPMLSLPLIPFFWLGLFNSLWRVVAYLVKGQRNSAPRDVETEAGRSSEAGDALPAAHLYLLCLWPVMLLPGILAPEGAPHHLRLIGTAPLSYAWVALGLGQAGRWLARLLVGRRQVGAPVAEAEDYHLGTGRRAGSSLWQGIVAAAASPLMALAIFVPVGVDTANAYFGQWSQRPDLAMAFDVYALRLAEHMAADRQPGVVYVLPMDQRAGHEARHYSLDFMYRGQTPYHYLPVDETSVERLLSEAVAGHELLRVVRWTDDKHIAADEREVVSFLLGTTARLVGRQSYPVYDIETWQLPSRQTLFRLPAIETPVGAIFDGMLQLEAAHVAVHGNRLAVALRWRPLAPMPVDYKASLRLVAADGRRIVQKDRYLRHNWHQGTHLWPAEAVNEYYLLPEAPAGEYRLQVVVYHPDTLAPLIVNGQAEVTLGSYRIMDSL